MSLRDRIEEPLVLGTIRLHEYVVDSALLIFVAAFAGIIALECSR